MLASSRSLLGALLLACACQSPAQPKSVTTRKFAEPEPPRAVSAASKEIDAPEDDLAPLVPVTADEVKAPLTGPAVLYGQGARNGRRPNAPGRHGDLLLAIDSPYQIFGRSGSYLHVAAWRREGTPAAGAQVYIDRKRVGVTNDHGTLVYRYETQGEDPESGSLFVIDGANHCGAVSFTPYTRTQTFAVDRLYVYTDRGVFQPGETVHIRAIGWRLKHDYSPLASAPIEFLLRDVRGHTVAAATATTDEFGVTATDVKVPSTADAGIYELRVSYGTERASTRLQVRRFAPPALRVEHTIGRFLLRSTPRALEFGVTVRPPANEKLKSVRIEVAAKTPAGKLIALLKKKVEGNGPHRLSFSKEQIAALIAATPEGELATIDIDVRDHLGRKERLTRELRVTA
ncbi:MAG TPA: MG2 domain-containing protein, partial [Polyangiaceae bacterium]|nr:MG2 domain-containing protein [Polyangiaceae bacterium]